MMEAGRASRTPERNLLHGHVLYDIFGDNTKGYDIFERFFIALRYALNKMHAQSQLITDYLHNVLMWETKSNFRLSLSVVILTIILHIAEATLLHPVSVYFPTSEICTLFFIILCLYLFTFRQLQYGTYRFLSWGLCIFMFALSCWSRCVLIRRDSRRYTNSFAIIVCSVILLPVSKPVALIISVMNFCMQILIQCHRTRDLDVSRYSTNYYSNMSWIYFDNFRRYNVLSESDFKPVAEFIAGAILQFLGFLLGIYVDCWNGIRRQIVFYRLSKNVRIRNAAQAALVDKVRWIEAIMPAQVTADFYQIQKRNEEAGKTMWVYNRVFDPVSILFADIVGFTKMSSNKSAIQLVTLLNDLFSRFDELCQLTRCEKIGTLGDCYYCVSGCPEPRVDHAQCCVEMGLGMCRIIKVFNCDHQETVNMRVGVHTGRVNAAIIGAQRFRYDVYSYDVIVANLMESSGQPGRVHISESTYNLVKSVYNVAPGEDMLIKREERSGIAGLALTTKTMKTYFVDPRSSILRRRHERFRAHVQLRAVDTDLLSEPVQIVADTKRETISARRTPSYARFSRGQMSLTGAQHTSIFCQREMARLEQDIELIQNLQTDSERQINLFRSPPLNPLMLNFLHHETEWHYRTHTVHHKVPTYIESLKVAILSDSLALTSVHIVITCICVLAHKLTPDWNGIYAMYYLAVLMFALVLLCLLLFSSTMYADQCQSPQLKQIYLCVAHNYGREVLIALLSTAPTISFLIFRQAIVTEHCISDYIGLFENLCWLCVLIHGLPQSSATWCRLICCVTCSVCIHKSYRPTRAQVRFCAWADDFVFGLSVRGLRHMHVLDFLFCIALVSIIARESERNCRLCFYVTRESEIASDLSDITVQEAQQLLFNIIPKYVYDELQTNGRENFSGSAFSYATLVPNAGVMFACVANFFSNYYREDYKGGEGALILLNSIMCTFDELLNRPEMKDVEKIKTINDCYMAAAGLNSAAVGRNPNKREHLILLMEYCHLVKEALDQFNALYIIGTDNFTVKIGYNFGPVTAGIIGTTKPLYDIWGDTVNVASRMYSTGLPGEIQVAEHVVPVLSDFFLFEFRGNVFVKGKGDMRTYVCRRK
ncbi:unnamed protein product [Echinostoma caproni]|uniref:Adenylate cyclase type 9 n=1 Tax=Echinostoma caproni TaxID=27848 RepID=A0A183B296_9TREM|nr:unnamed protein product [Echinostoma caproni]